MQNIHHAIDIHIGKRTKQRRIELELSLEKLSLASGISINELNKIEEGKARVAAYQVFNLIHALHIPASYFFEKYNGQRDSEIDRLIFAYLHIHPETLRREFLCLLESTANNQQ